MKVGMIGLGRMGCAMVQRLLVKGHDCVVFDSDTSSYSELESAGAICASSLEEFADSLDNPRVVWIMLPDVVVDSVISDVSGHLDKGDIVIDGGNTYFEKDHERWSMLAESGIHYLDVGTSGGVWGRERGYCLMIGGDKAVADQLEPIFQALSPDKDSVGSTPGNANEMSTAEYGYLYCGGSGSGHFVKMVHNGIEYGMMAAYAEGFQMLCTAGNQGETESGSGIPDLEANSAQIAELWRRGSVVGSWLLDLAASSLRNDPDLGAFEGHVPDSGEGRWTVETASRLGVPAYVLSAALFQRFNSRGEGNYGNKVLSALRQQFGGHSESQN